MDNRFGFKDLVLTVLLLAILVSIWLGMKQADRQHDTLRAITEATKQQSAAQARMERQLANLAATGLSVAPGTAAGAGALALDGFAPAADLADPFAERAGVRSAADFADGDWLIDAFPVNVAKITPFTTRDLYGSIVQSYAIETLATRDPDTFAWMPLLASTWKSEPNVEAWQAWVDERLAVPLTKDEVRAEPAYEAIDEPAERTAYVARRLEEGRRLEDVAREPEAPAAVTHIFRLRRGVTFSDGEPLTAADVVFTYNLLGNPAVDVGPNRITFDQLKSVTALDDHTVALAFNQPYFDSFQTAGGFPVLPEHFYGPLDGPEGAARVERLNTAPGLLLGSGPFKVAAGADAWAPGQEIALERNDRYWGEPSAFEQLVFREITSDSARLTAFKNGDVDNFDRAIPEQYVAYLNDAGLVERSQSIEAFRVNDGYGWIAWNQEKNGKPTPFADPRVRRAMTMLIDRQQIVDVSLKGYGLIPSGPFNPLSPQFNPEVQPLAFDPGAARALLKEAGYEDRDGDGVVEDAQGVPLEIRHTYPASGNFWNDVSLMIKDTMAQGGVRFVPDPLEWSVFSEKARSTDFDSISMAWGAGIETDIRHAFHSSQIGGGKNNFPAYRSSEVDRLIDAALTNLDEGERMALWRQVHAQLNQDQPYTFLYVRKYLTMADGRFGNFRETKVGTNDRLDWYAPASLQKY